MLSETELLMDFEMKQGMVRHALILWRTEFIFGFFVDRSIGQAAFAAWLVVSFPSASPLPTRGSSAGGDPQNG